MPKKPSRWVVLLIVSSFVIFDRLPLKWFAWFNMTLMMEGFTDSINICNRAKFFSLFKWNDIAAREASVHDGAHSHSYIFFSLSSKWVKDKNKAHLFSNAVIIENWEGSPKWIIVCKKRVKVPLSAHNVFATSELLYHVKKSREEEEDSAPME